MGPVHRWGSSSWQEGCNERGSQEHKAEYEKDQRMEVSLPCALLFDLQGSFWTCCRISICVCQPPASAPRFARFSGDNLFCAAAVGQDNPRFCLFCAWGCIYLSAHEWLSSPSCIAQGIGFQLAPSGSGWLWQVEQLWEGDGSVQGVLHQFVSDVHRRLTQCRFTASFLHGWQG